LLAGRAHGRGGHPENQGRILGDFMINLAVLKTRHWEKFIPGEFFAQGG
jgi:hypothetical protein